MGQTQSKDELLYQQVNYGNTEGIKALRHDGAGLEWLDKEGKTPLIAACMNPELYNVAKTLIELGANVNAYRPGRHAGTPLHHAAKRGLEPTVSLLLANGANALVMNDDCQTPLDVARVKGFGNVVRAIEGRICLFSGWMREFYGPGFLELFAPQLLTRKVWVVVLPCGSRNLSKPFKLELAIYSSPQDAQPRTIIALWKANLDEPKLNQADPSVVISDISNIPRRWRRRRGIMSSQEARPARCKTHGSRQSRIKLAPANENDKQQLQWFCNACKGIPQVIQPSFPFHSQGPAAASAPSTAEDLELAMAISASLQSAQERPQPLGYQPCPPAHSSTSWTNPTVMTNDNASVSLGGPAPRKGSSSGLEFQEVGTSGSLASQINTPSDVPPVVQTTIENPNPVSAPSAPPVSDEIIGDGPIHYPSIDSTPVDFSSPAVETSSAPSADGGKEDGTSSSCVICLDAPVEGACIPCGHMAGCMSCLNEIKAKKWGCPVCRTKIDQVIRLYAV